MTCVPRPNAEVDIEATPLDSATVPRSVFVVVSTKSTLPVGVPEPLGRTVAVNVTDWPGLEVAALVVRAVQLSVVAGSIVPCALRVSRTAGVALGVGFRRDSRR